MADAPRHILALDCGTTSVRGIVFALQPDAAAAEIGTGQREFAQHFPKPGWVEHDADEIWTALAACMKDALAASKRAASDIAAIGITNQRETIVVWDRATGKPIHRAIVWQDRRTASRLVELRAEGHEDTVRAATGLTLDPYFSATKLAWILDAVPGARARADKGELAAGTIDSWVLWKLTNGRVHACFKIQKDVVRGGYRLVLCWRWYFFCLRRLCAPRSYHERRAFSAARARTECACAHTLTHGAAEFQNAARACSQLLAVQTAESCACRTPIDFC